MIVIERSRRVGQTMVAELTAAIEATDIHELLVARGFAFQPVRTSHALKNGNLRLRLTWKKTDGAETQIVRLTHVVTVPDRV